MYVSKDVLNHYLVHSSAFNSLKSAKNVLFFHSAFWSTYQWGGVIAPRPPSPPPPGYATAQEAAK